MDQSASSIFAEFGALTARAGPLHHPSHEKIVKKEKKLKAADSGSISRQNGDNRENNGKT